MLRAYAGFHGFSQNSYQQVINVHPSSRVATI